jgi:hypothetical protein
MDVTLENAHELLLDEMALLFWEAPWLCQPVGLEMPGKPLLCTKHRRLTGLRTAKSNASQWKR